MANDVLSLTFKFIHLVATVAWIGGMFTNFFIYMPVFRKELEAPVAGKLMGAVMKRFRVMVYSSMIVFFISGMLLGYLHMETGVSDASLDMWNALLLVKVSLFAIMVILALYAFEILAPKVAEIATGGPSPRLRKAQMKQMALAAAGFLLGLAVLGISAAL